MVTHEANQARHQAPWRMKHVDHDQGRHCQERDEEEHRLVGIVDIKPGGPRAGEQEQRRHHQERRPQSAGHGRGPLVQVAFGFDRQPQGAVHQKEQEEEHAPGQAVRVDQGEQAPLIDAALVDGHAPEDIGEGHPQQQGGQEAAQGQTGIPEASPPGLSTSLRNAKETPRRIKANSTSIRAE